MYAFNKYSLLKVNSYWYLCNTFKNSCYPNSVDLTFTKGPRIELAFLFEYKSVLENKNLLICKASAENFM